MSARVSFGAATPVTDNINHQPCTHPRRDDDGAIFFVASNRDNLAKPKSVVGSTETKESYFQRFQLNEHIISVFTLLPRRYKDSCLLVLGPAVLKPDFNLRTILRIG